MTVDSFLIDRVFQPVSERLDRFGSCYEIAGFLFIGSGTLFLVVALRFFSASLPGDGLFTGLLLPMCYLWYREACRAQRTVRIGAVPLFRLTGRITRTLYLAWSIYSLVGDLFLFPPMLADLAFWVMTAGTYFLACSPRPPRRQEVKIPKNAAVQGGG